MFLSKIEIFRDKTKFGVCFLTCCVLSLKRKSSYIITNTDIDFIHNDIIILIERR